MKFLTILDTLISEQKRYKFQPEVYDKINSVVDRLWNDRDKKYTKKELVDVIQFKLADGTDGIVRVIVNPRLSYIGFMDTKPKKSIDPTDIFIEVNPKHYKSKKNLYLTIYHEMIHASDPNLTHKWTPSYESTYNVKRDDMYWGHPIEFFAITNEFLEGLVLEFKRRKPRLRNPENTIHLKRSLNNILNYFANGQKLTKQSLNILYRINDEYVNQNRISKVLADIETEFPKVSDMIPEKKDDIPYYLNYIELIKKYNPKIWGRFLTMLYKTSSEIKDILK
jgi:hypothetical protein